jgi:hypothetical protein
MIQQLAGGVKQFFRDFASFNRNEVGGPRRTAPFPEHLR